MRNISRSISAKRACPVCNNPSYTHFADEHIDSQKMNDFTYASRKQPEFMCLSLVRCKNCDLVYAPAPPHTDFLLRAYSEAAYDSVSEAQAAADSYAKALTSHINRLTTRTTAVDVGAGSGPLLSWLCKAGFENVIGIEPSKAAIQAAAPSIRPMLREGFFSSELLNDVKPSLLCSFMTLEHMADPSAFVRTSYDLLEPGGMIAIVVHNWQAFLNRILGLHSPIIDIEHLQLFNPRSIRILLEKAGFQAITVQSISNSYPLQYWLRLTPLPTKIKIHLNTMLTHMRLSKIKIPFRVGNLLAVGTKFLENTQ